MFIQSSLELYLWFSVLYVVELLNIDDTGGAGEYFNMPMVLSIQVYRVSSFACNRRSSMSMIDVILFSVLNKQNMCV